MAKQYEIRLAGTGGQGAILAGILLAEAAIRDGKNVTHLPVYCPDGVSVGSQLHFAYKAVHGKVVCPSILSIYCVYSTGGPIIYQKVLSAQDHLSKKKKALIYFHSRRGIEN